MYVRVSKVGARKGTENFYSPDQQETAIRAEVAKCGYTIKPGDPYTDLDVSGGSMDRPAFNKAMAWVKEDPSRRAIGVYAADRWGRELGSALSVLKQLYDVGGEVLFSGLSVDVSTADGEVVITTLLLAASMQRSMISKRWRDTGESRLQRGLPTGGPTRFGYRVVEGTRVLQKDPVKGPILAQMYRDYLNGKGSQAIAKDLNDPSRPGGPVLTERGNPFNVSSVQRAMDSGFGAGFIRVAQDGDEVGQRTKHHLDGTSSTVRLYEDNFIEGKHEAVISRQEWRRYRKERERRRQAPPKNRSPRWFLSQLARCGRPDHNGEPCNGPMFVNSYTASKSQAICSVYRSTRTCEGVWINRTYLESIVGSWLRGQIDTLASQAAGRVESQRDQIIKADAAVIAAEEAVDRLVDKQSRMLLLAADADPEAFKSAASTMARELKVARVALEDAQAIRASAGVEPGVDVYDRLIMAVSGLEYAKAFGVQMTDSDGHQSIGVPALDEDDLPSTMQPSEWNALLKKVIESVVVTKDTVTITPKQIGRAKVKPVVYKRWNAPRIRTDMVRGADGKFSGKADA